jgi:hypothetical protein
METKIRVKAILYATVAMSLMILFIYGFVSILLNLITK